MMLTQNTTNNLLCDLRAIRGEIFTFTSPPLPHSHESASYPEKEYPAQNYQSKSMAALCPPESTPQFPLPASAGEQSPADLHVSGPEIFPESIHLCICREYIPALPVWAQPAQLLRVKKHWDKTLPAS